MLTLEQIENINTTCQVISSKEIKPSYGFRSDKDKETLHSILYRIENSVVFGVETLPKLEDKAFKLFEEICFKQIFKNGNKRTSIFAFKIYSLMLGREHEINTESFIEHLSKVFENRESIEVLKSFLTVEFVETNKIDFDEAFKIVFKDEENLKLNKLLSVI